MKKHLFIIAMLALCSCINARAQNKQPASQAPARSTQTTGAPQTRANGFDLAEYGVKIQPEPRLIIMMAALDAAGFDSTPPGREPPVFLKQLRQEQSALDPALRKRLRDFYERRKLPAPAMPAEQAARYVSLAYALGAPPAFETPERTDDLPAGVLDVLDFAPLLREFYRKSGIDERLPAYMRAYSIEGDRLRAPTAEMVRAVLSYLHTRPITVAFDRVVVRSPTTGGKQKKDAPKATSVRERERRFYIVPDLLAVPGAINFRVITDDYYAVAPAGTDPASSELRRAYLQYVIDPLVLRNSRAIVERRPVIRQLIDERSKAGASVSPDVFLAVSRSLVAAADARLEETKRLDALALETRGRLGSAKDESARAAIVKETQAARTVIEDEAAAQLADAYERGAVLSFYFAEKLHDVETSGFDIANFLADMIATIDPARESRRPVEYAAARERALTARRARQSAQAQANRLAAENTEGTNAAGRSRLVKSLIEVDEMLRMKNYEAADARLRALLQEFPGEPRILFALGETANLSARLATDEDVQNARLNGALTNYRLAIRASSGDTDPALLSRAHEAMGRIYAFMGQTDEALKEYDAAILIGPVPGGAMKEAQAGKQKLVQPK